MNSFFTEYDMDSWKHAGNFNFYTKVMPTGFNTCVDLDITKTYELAKIKGVKFSACYLFLLSKIMNEVVNRNSYHFQLQFIMEFVTDIY